MVVGRDEKIPFRCLSEKLRKLGGDMSGRVDRRGSWKGDVPKEFLGKRKEVAFP